MKGNIYLLKYSDNWADEIDVDGHCVIDEDKKKEFTKAIKNFNHGFFYIGTNEEIEYDKNSIQNAFDIRKISKEELRVLEILDISEVGFAGYFIDFVIECVGDDE